MSRSGSRKRAATTTESLLHEHGRQWHAMLWRIVQDTAVAEELLQEVALRLMRRLAEPDPPADPAAYATSIAVNLAFDHVRARSRHRPREDPYSAADLATADPAPPAVAEQSELRELILAAAARLPEETREAFSRHYLAGESYHEIARAMDKSPQQVRGLCHHAVRLLRTQLREKGD